MKDLIVVKNIVKYVPLLKDDNSRYEDYKQQNELYILHLN